MCNKHGCDYKGYGYAGKVPRLNLSEYQHETERFRPILQEWCCKCYEKESFPGNCIVQCDGCCRAFHQNCYSSFIPSIVLKSNKRWYCDVSCQATSMNGKIMIELPKKELPMMKLKRRSCRSSIGLSKKVGKTVVKRNIDQKRRSSSRVASHSLWNEADKSLLPPLDMVNLLPIPKFIKNGMSFYLLEN